MKKLLLVCMMALVAKSSLAQVVEGFENVTLDSGKVLNGLAGETVYQFPHSGANLNLPTFWDTSFGGFWASGWAISKKIDSTTTTSNFAKHLYCAKPGRGGNNSNTFAIGQNYSTFYVTGGNLRIKEFYITNSTYAYNSMKFGDAFGKKFGGASGHDSDFFLCKIRTFYTGILTDSQEVYLADFRSSDSTKDYILDSWHRVSIGAMSDSMTFELISSDNSAWGMNTPGFFALDDIALAQISNVRKMNNTAVKIWPNPAGDFFSVQSNSEILSLQILGANGQEVLEFSGYRNKEVKCNTAALSNGIYTARLLTSSGVSNIRFMVQH